MQLNDLYQSILSQVDTITNSSIPKAKEAGNIHWPENLQAEHSEKLDLLKNLLYCNQKDLDAVIRRVGKDTYSSVELAEIVIEYHQSKEDN